MEYFIRRATGGNPGHDGPGVPFATVNGGGKVYHGRQSADLYELILNRHRVSSFIITSNRAVEEWLSIFDDPILGNGALDRLANASYQIVIEGSSYRERLSPPGLCWRQGAVIEQPTAN